MHLESIGFTATAPGASGAAAAAVSGDSLTCKFGTRPRILQTWCDFQGSGFLQIAFPTGHDTTRGFRCRVIASEVTPRMAMGIAMPLSQQETMTLTVAGSAVAGDVENGILLMAYDDMPGSNQNLASWSEVKRRTEKLTTIDGSLTAAGSGGTWSGSESIMADSDLLIANRDYALLGIEIGVECAAVSIKGPDTAGVRIAVPGSTEFADLSNQWFAVLSRAYDDMKCIPVINSANKANTLLECLQDENNAAVTFSLMLALLK